jgi:CRP/FNR family transcriptional regulator
VISESVVQHLKVFNEISREELEKILNQSELSSFEPKTLLFLEGDKCNHLPIVLKGGIRVFKISENERDITFYKIAKGESCILTSSCIINNHQFPALAETIEDTKILFVPSSLFLTLIDESKAWRNFVFNIYNKRIANVMLTLETSVFVSMEKRLAKYLTTIFYNDYEIEVIHQDIAKELGTSREVISRLLKRFEKMELIQLGRGKISLLNPSKLFQHETKYGYLRQQN